jgi:hypothetical protein
MFWHVIEIALGLAFGTVVVLTVVLASRNRPPQAPRRHPGPYRVRGRSIRGWQASAIREIRRAGRQHGTRGR